MTDRKKLSEPEMQENLSQLPGWTIENGKLNKMFQFNSFIDAFGFMTKAPWQWRL